jgi:pyocin large subunit-like protein
MWHANDMKLTWKQYEENGVKFANEISPENLSFIRDDNKVTYKYKEKTNELVLVDKNGYIVTYYYPTDGKKYYERQKLKYERRYEENEK